MFVSGLSTIVVATFLRICTDVTSRRPVTIYRPQCPPGYCSVGDYAQPSFAHEQNYGVTLCFRATNNDSSLLARPVGYRHIWSTEHDGYDDEYSGSGSGSGSGSSEYAPQRIIAFWRAIPPTDDYVSIGDVITSDYAQPPISATCVVHKSLVTTATAGRRVWRDNSGAASIWMTSRSHDYLDLRTFRTNDHKGPPEEFRSLILEVLPAPYDSSLITETIGEKDLKLLYRYQKGCEDLSIYVPQPPKGFMSLGHYAQKNDQSHNNGPVSVVQELSTSHKSLLVAPTGYQKIIDHVDRCNSSVKLTYWRPIASPGYHCVGDVVTVNQNTPPPSHAITCLHWSLVTQSQRGSRIWWNRKQHSNSKHGFTLWGVGGRAGCESPNTFVAHQGFVTPPSERDLFHCIASPSIEI